MPTSATPSSPVSQRSSAYRVPDWVELRGTDLSALSHAEQGALFRRILSRGIHGLAFSPYVGEQAPGHEISEAQVRERLAIIAPHVRWIRTFSSIEGHQHAPRVARELGLKTMVGVDLGPDLDTNEEQLAAGIAIAQAGHADILAVGNENMLREDLTEAQLIGYIERAKAAVPDGVPVSFVDAYYLFEQHPAVTAAVDVLLVNCYPFWESCPAEYALLYMKEMYRRAQAVAGGKKVIISETGWPSAGSPFGDAVPSRENALEYFVRAVQWTEEEGIDLFYFAAFDEAWKVGGEGDVGAYWGLWDTTNTLKYGADA